MPTVEKKPQTRHKHRLLEARVSRDFVYCHIVDVKFFVSEEKVLLHSVL